MPKPPFPTGLALIAFCVCLALPEMSAAQVAGGRVATVASEDGSRITYEVFGRGPALILVHGWSCDRTYWAAQLTPFAGKFTVVTIDLAGHGASGMGRKDYTMESFGADVAAVVNALTLKRVVLIGHSMGGDVIAEAARRLPGRVAGMVWVDTYKQLNAASPPGQIEALAAKLRGDFVGVAKPLVRGMFVPSSDPILVERVAADMAAAPPEVAVSALTFALGYGRTMPGTLQELKLPVIAINPDNSPTDAESMTRYGVQVMIMPGVGHFLHMEAPARFNTLLAAAITKLNP